MSSIKIMNGNILVTLWGGLQFSRKFILKSCGPHAFYKARIRNICLEPPSQSEGDHHWPRLALRRCPRAALDLRGAFLCDIRSKFCAAFWLLQTPRASWILPWGENKNKNKTQCSTLSRRDKCFNLNIPAQCPLLGPWILSAVSFWVKSPEF